MRITSLKLATLALIIAASIAMVPAASATTIPITFGGTTVGSATITTGGSCAAGDTCITITMTGGNQIRFGGDVIGLQGTITADTTDDVSPGIDSDSSGLLSIASHKCNANLRSATDSVCITAGSGANATTLTLVLDGTITGFVGLHIIGPACGPAQGDSFPTCFASGGTPSSVPEPGTLGLLGTGLVGIAGLVRRRFTK